MPVITVTTVPPVDPQTSTPTFYQQLVGEFMVAFDQMYTIIPKVMESEAVTAEEVRANLGVPYAFCVTAINAVEQLPELHAAKLDPEKARNLLQFIEAFTPLYDKMVTGTRRLRHALRGAKSEVGSRSLQVLRVARSIASDRRSPAIDAQIEAMRRDLGRRSFSKAEREERKARKLKEAVDQELRRLGIDRALLEKEREKEVRAA